MTSVLEKTSARALPGLRGQLRGQQAPRQGRRRFPNRDFYTGHYVTGRKDGVVYVCANGSLRARVARWPLHGRHHHAKGALHGEWQSNKLLSGTQRHTNRMYEHEDTCKL